MSILFGNILGSILYGFLLSLLLIGICYLIPQGLYAHPKYPAGSIAVMVIAFFFFLFQSTLLVGGFKAKKYIGQIQAVVTSLPIGNQNDVLSTEDCRQLIDRATAQYPFLSGRLRELQQISGTISNRSDLAAAIGRQLRSQVNGYIARRFGWLAGGLVAVGLAVCGLCTERKQRVTTGNRRHYSSSYSSRRYYK